MLAAPAPEHRRRDLAWLLLACATVLATIPIARALTGFLEGAFGASVFIVLTVAGLGALAWLAIRTLRDAPFRARAWIVATALGLAGYAFAMQDNAIEALHLLEYSVVSVLAFRALGHHIRDRTLYPSAILVGALLGIVDEGLQWLMPGRVFDPRDIGFDVLAAAIAQLPIAFGVRPGWVEPRTTRSGWHRFCGIGFVTTLVLVTVLSATPPRVARLAEALPFLAFLERHPDVMLEYGEFVTLPNGTRFRTRLGLAGLIEEDRARADEAGETLRRWRSDERYGEFLRHFTPIGDPFLHEMRVHLFRRDRYLETAERHRQERPRQFRHDRAIALREQEILEAGFARTMRAAGWDIDAETRSALDAEDHPVNGYVSRVSESLITEWSETQVLAAPVSACALFGLGWLGTRERARR